MGCGTSILAILASMRGAEKVTAIDIDDWCVNNSRDNIALNGISNITVELGDASLLNGREPFDVVIANINRNILLHAGLCGLHEERFGTVHQRILHGRHSGAARKSGESGHGIRASPRKAQLGCREIYHEISKLPK